MGISRKAKKHEYMNEKYLDDAALKEKLFDDLEFNVLTHDFDVEESEEEESTENPTAVLIEYPVRKRTLWERFYAFLEKEYKIYRAITGRLNRPKTYAENIFHDGSENERGLYDQFTFGLLWIPETLFRFNWVPEPTVRTILAVIFSPIWVPLNLLRATVGVVGTIIATPFVLLYEHYSEKASIKQEQNDLVKLEQERVVESRSKEEDAEQLGCVTDLVLGLTAERPPSSKVKFSLPIEENLPPALQAILSSRTEEESRNDYTQHQAEDDLPSVDQLPTARDEGDYFEIKSQGVLTTPYRVKPGDTNHQYDAIIQLATEGNPADASQCPLIDQKQRKQYSTNRYSNWIVHKKISESEEKGRDKTTYYAFIPPPQPVDLLDFSSSDNTSQLR